MKSFKGTKDNKNNILKKIPIKKDFINERSKSQSQKNKNEKISKEKKTKTITTESRNKNKIIISNEKGIKSSKNDKKKEKIDNNNIKKQGDKSKEGIKYNVVSMGNKYKSIINFFFFFIIFRTFYSFFITNYYFIFIS